MLVGDLDHGARDDNLFGGQVLGSGRLGGLLAIEIRQGRSKVCRVVVRLGVRRWHALRCAGRSPLVADRLASVDVSREVGFRMASVASAVISGARVSISVFRVCSLVWSGLWTLYSH